MPTYKNSMIPAMSSTCTYTPYGLRNANAEPTAALAFNGEFLFAALQCYALGNGHRFYNPRLMRFISPDTLSPFLKGGINTYAYCLNDPINATDPSGKFQIATRGANMGLLTAFNTSRKGFFRGIATLINRQPSKLKSELTFLDQGLSKSTLSTTEVSSIGDLRHITSTYDHKFTFTERNTLYIATTFSGRSPAHAAVAERSHWRPGSSNEVLTAGYLYIKDGKFYVNNHSGHFLPPFESLQFAVEFFSKLSIDVKAVAANVGSSSWAAASGALSSSVVAAAYAARQPTIR